MKGKLIVIEGIDNSGKETQANLLVKKLEERGEKALKFSFPCYDTPTGRIIAEPILGKGNVNPSWFQEGVNNIDPYIACLYYAADRKYNIKTIEEYLSQGYYVVLDRYTSSNMSYQGSKIKDVNERFNMFQWIDKLEYWLLKLPKPDRTFLLNIPADLAASLKEVADIEQEKLTNQTYIELSELYNWNVIECAPNGVLRSIEDINQEILDHIEKR